MAVRIALQCPVRLRGARPAATKAGSERFLIRTQPENLWNAALAYGLVPLLTISLLGGGLRGLGFDCCEFCSEFCS